MVGCERRAPLSRRSLGEKKSKVESTHRVWVLFHSIFCLFSVRERSDERGARGRGAATSRAGESWRSSARSRSAARPSFRIFPGCYICIPQPLERGQSGSALLLARARTFRPFSSACPSWPCRPSRRTCSSGPCPWPRPSWGPPPWRTSSWQFS